MRAVKLQKSQAKNIESVRRYRANVIKNEVMKQRIAKLQNRANRNYYRKSSTKDNPELALKRYRSVGKKLDISYILQEMCSLTPSGSYECNLDIFRYRFRGKTRSADNGKSYENTEYFLEFVRLVTMPGFDFVTLRENTAIIHVTVFDDFHILDLPKTAATFDRAFLIHKNTLYHFDYRNVVPIPALAIAVKYTKRCNPQDYKNINLGSFVKEYGYTIESFRTNYIEIEEDEDEFDI